MKLSEIIFLERHRKRLSQTELGKRAGISRNYVSLIEGDAATPSLAVLERLALALDLTLHIELTSAPARAAKGEE